MAPTSCNNKENNILDSKYLALGLTTTFLSRSFPRSYKKINNAEAEDGVAG